MADPQTHPDTADHLAGGTEETREIQRVALYAFLLNLGLSGLKIVLAYFSGSLALAASAVDSGTDSVASLAVFGGLKLSTRKSPAFPYGLYKIENVISVIMAIFIFLAGFEIVRKALSPAAAPPAIRLWVIGWLVGAVLLTFLFGQYAIAVGRRTESPTLIAEGRHRQVDVFSTIVVLFAIVLAYFRVHIDFLPITFDHVAAGLVVVFIARSGWELLSDGMRVLLDASLDPQTLDQVRKIIESEPMVTEVRWLAGRNAGRFRFIETYVVMRTVDLAKAHVTSHRIEAEIRKRVPHVERVVIHYAPQARKYLHVAVPLTDMMGKVSDHFGGAPYFALVLLRLSDGQIERQQVVANPHTDVAKAKGIRVAEWLVNQKVDVVAVKEDLHKKGPAYVFADAGVELKVLLNDQLDRVIESLKSS